MSNRMPRFFRQVKPKKFDYRPVFYDRKKEILNERVREGLKGDLFVPTIQKGSFREYHSQRHSNLKRKSNIRMIVIMVLLVLVIMLIILF